MKASRAKMSNVSADTSASFVRAPGLGPAGWWLSSLLLPRPRSSPHCSLRCYLSKSYRRNQQGHVWTLAKIAARPVPTSAPAPGNCGLLLATVCVLQFPPGAATPYGFHPSPDLLPCRGRWGQAQNSGSLQPGNRHRRRAAANGRPVARGK